MCLIRLIVSFLQDRICIDWNSAEQINYLNAGYMSNWNPVKCVWVSCI